MTVKEVKDLMVEDIFRRLDDFDCEAGHYYFRVKNAEGDVIGCVRETIIEYNVSDNCSVNKDLANNMDMLLHEGFHIYYNVDLFEEE